MTTVHTVVEMKSGTEWSVPAVESLSKIKNRLRIGVGLRLRTYTKPSCDLIQSLRCKERSLWVNLAAPLFCRLYQITLNEKAFNISSHLKNFLLYL